MTKLKVYLLTYLLFSSFALSSQEKQKTILVFYINEANINGVDYTKEYVESESYITFYMNLSDSILTMANVMSLPKTQSYGYIKPFELANKTEPNDSIGTQRSYYKWNYTNSYNDTTGTAIIELIQQIKEEKKYFILKMFTSHSDFCLYKGYSYDLYAGLITENKK